MTLQLDDRIDELIARVRHHGAAADFIYIPAYPAHKSPNPVTQYTVAVTNAETKESTFFVGNRVGYNTSGRLYEAKLRLRVYAPGNTSGSSLLRAVGIVAEALEAEDRDKLIESISVSGIGYETASRTEYRDIAVCISTILCKEDKV